MRIDEFDECLDLLPEQFRERARALRPSLNRSGCDRCEKVADAVETALLAARYDELAHAERLIETAEGLAQHHDHAAVDRCRLDGNHRATFRRRDVVPEWEGASGELVAATDASWKHRTHGIGYVVSNGHFGLHGWPATWLDPSGPARVLVDELRAVEFLLSGLPDTATRMTVLIDSVPALTYLRRWQSGETTLPDGYSLRPRTSGAKPTLVRLAELVARLPNVSFQHVDSHNGHPLNEAADSLSRMARRRVHERFDIRTRARDLVNAFLRDWHTGRGAALAA
jgi:ribonuclease HI